MDVILAIESLRRSTPVEWPLDAQKLEFAEQLDHDHNLVNLRDEFLIPTKAQLQRRSLRDLPHTESGVLSAQPSIYFCGNSLGLQAKAVSEHLNAYLKTWGSIAVSGHFTQLEDSPLVPYQDMAAECARMSASIVGAAPEEVVIMNTLTVNLHMMMAAFYKPTEKKHKIMCEWRPFPSDWVSPVSAGANRTVTDA
jgi:kynureninase